VESKVVGARQEITCLNALYNPVGPEDISPEEVNFDCIALDGRELVSETFVEVTDHASMCLDQDLDVVLLRAEW